MSISDHLRTVTRLRGRVTTVNVEQRIVEVATSDGQAHRLVMSEIPPTFRWPVEGEEWSIYQENGYWKLGSRFENGEELHSVDDMEPGESKIHSKHVFDDRGQRVVTVFVEGAEEHQYPAWDGVDGFVLESPPEPGGAELPETEFLDLTPLLNPGWTDWGYRSPADHSVPALSLMRNGKIVSTMGLLTFDAEGWLSSNVGGSDGRTLNDMGAGEPFDVTKSRFYGGRNILTFGSGAANMIGKNGARTSMPNASTAGSVKIPLDWCPPNSILLTCALDWESSSAANQEYGDDPFALTNEPTDVNGYGTWAKHRSPESRGRFVQIYLQVLNTGTPTSKYGGYMWIFGYSPQPPMRDYLGGYFDGTIPGDASCGIVLDGQSWMVR